MRSGLRSAAIVAGITFALAELALRAIPFVAGDPLRSLVHESQRIPLSNARTYGGTRILLPPPQDADIAAVGDSFPFGTFVREQDTFVSLLARDAGRTAVNLSVGSQDPIGYQRMVELAVAYRPEVLLYCVFANDFRYGDAVVPRALSDAQPFGSRDEDRRLYIASVAAVERVETVARKLSNLSGLNLLRKLLAQPAPRHQPIRWQRQGLSYMFAPASYWDPQISWHDAAVRRATALNAALITAANRFVSPRGTRVIAVLIPSKEMVHGPMVGDAIYRDAHHETYRELASRLEDAGIAAVDLTPPLRALAEEHQQLYFTIDGHWNDAGHRAAASALRSAVTAPPTSP